MVGRSYEERSSFCGGDHGPGEAPWEVSTDKVCKVVAANAPCWRKQMAAIQLWAHDGTFLLILLHKWVAPRHRDSATEGDLFLKHLQHNFLCLSQRYSCMLKVFSIQQLGERSFVKIEIPQREKEEKEKKTEEEEEEREERETSLLCE